MARHYPSEPRVEVVVERLVELFLRLGSVNAVADALTDQAAGDGQQRIYPNRVHGLLTGDPTRSINTATLEALEAALDGIGPLGNGTSDVTTRIQQALAAESTSTTDTDEAIHRVAEYLDVPVAVVRVTIDVSASRATPAERTAPIEEPDWSWQNDAINRSLFALRKGPNYKAGLIVPTGGGKTKISLRIILRWLAEGARTDTVVLWLTHRTRLQLQARRALQQLLGDSDDVPEAAATFFADRVKFVMLSQLPSAIAEYGERIALVVVDEAHHAAAPSYEPIFTDLVTPGLFLTATPNRADALPIGIDEIAYTITYRELLERGCVIEPVFDPPVDLYGLDWRSPEGLEELADYVLDRTEQDFRKVLVAVSKQERAEVLYEAIAELLDGRPHHPLTADDVAYVHGSATSGHGSPNDYLDEFTARPRGVLVATSQLVGEGFDDPSLDAAVITYPSTSISHLMQVAGRALRYAPGKKRAHIVQVRESALEYHFEQRWLYQDISDALHPDLIDLPYSTREDLEQRLAAVLDAHRVSEPVRERIERELEEVETGQEVRLMLTGVPYYGASESFDRDAEWGATLVTPSQRERFVHVFNNLSYRTDDLKEQAKYVDEFVARDHRAGSLWKSYIDLVAAIEYARRELTHTTYAGHERRNYRDNLGSTWLRYVSFAFSPAVPAELDLFLTDATNRDEVIADYLQRRDSWAAAVRLELPLTSSYGFLLTLEQADWLIAERQAITDRLRDTAPERSFDELISWRGSLTAVPLPVRLIDQAAQMIRPERFAAQYLDLRPFI